MVIAILIGHSERRVGVHRERGAVGAREEDRGFRLKGQPERRGLAAGCPDARLVLKALKLVDQRPPAPPEGEDTVMS